MNNPDAFSRAGVFSVAYQDKGSRGMTLLDYFAGQALIGLALKTSDHSFANDAVDAYRYASAMLEEREQTMKRIKELK